VGAGVLWFAALAFASRAGAFEAAAGALPIALVAAIAVPVVGAVLLYRLSRPVRAWVRGLDGRVLVLAQTARVIGGVFLAFWALGMLPAVFALPAGLGDVAVGVAAFVLTARWLRSGEVGRGSLLWFNLLGLGDFVVAVAIGLALQVSGAGAGVLGAFPVNLVPLFAVPVFILVHFASLAGLAARTVDRAGVLRGPVPGASGG